MSMGGCSMHCRSWNQSETTLLEMDVALVGNQPQFLQDFIKNSISVWLADGKKMFDCLDANYSKAYIGPHTVHLVNKWGRSYSSGKQICELRFCELFSAYCDCMLYVVCHSICNLLGFVQKTSLWNWLEFNVIKPSLRSVGGVLSMDGVWRGNAW